MAFNIGAVSCWNRLRAVTSWLNSCIRHSSRLNGNSASVSSHRDGIRHCASEFGTHLFNLEKARDSRRIHGIRSGLKNFQHFSSNFGTEIRPRFSSFLGEITHFYFKGPRFSEMICHRLSPQPCLGAEVTIFRTRQLFILQSRDDLVSQFPVCSGRCPAGEGAHSLDRQADVEDDCQVFDQAVVKPNRCLVVFYKMHIAQLSVATAVFKSSVRSAGDQGCVQCICRLLSGRKPDWQEIIRLDNGKT